MGVDVQANMQTWLYLKWQLIERGGRMGARHLQCEPMRRKPAAGARRSLRRSDLGSRIGVDLPARVQVWLDSDQRIIAHGGSTDTRHLQHQHPRIRIGVQAHLNDWAFSE